MTQILKVNRLKKSFGEVQAVNDVSFAVGRGEIVGLAGPNGTGKTTTFNMITGNMSPDAGTVEFRGSDITGSKPHEVVDKGLSRTFQEVRIFPEMTVLENMLFAAQEKSLRRNARHLLSGTSLEQIDEDNRSRAMELLETVDMARLADDKAVNCSYGQRKILEFANSLFLNPEPTMVLLDEPAAGVNPTMMNRLSEYIEMFNEDGTTFLVIEHNLRVLMNLCDKIIVLVAGEKLAEGKPQDIQNDERVMEAYLSG